MCAAERPIDALVIDSLLYKMVAVGLHLWAQQCGSRLPIFIIYIQKLAFVSKKQFADQSTRRQVSQWSQWSFRDTAKLSVRFPLSVLIGV